MTTRPFPTTLTLALFPSFWNLATDALPPQDSANLAEELGIEQDTAEHIAFDRLSVKQGLKRKRE
jgi:26S proteasome regulatory subunit (ATPase 3-interacting protein)